MQVMKSFKQPKLSLVVFALVLVGCLLFYISSNPFQGGRFKSSFWRNKNSMTNAEHRELAKVLRNASMPDRTVILTTLNEAWASPGSVIDLFLESFQIGEGTQSLLNHLVIAAVDQKAYNRCISIHPHCYELTTPGIDFAAEKRFMTPDYLKLMWRRIEFLRIVLELGYNFVFTDADIMWFRDPFRHFAAPDELTIACDSYMGNPTDNKNRANGGFNYVKSNERTIEFYKYWYMARVLYPGKHDQHVFEIIKNHPAVNMMGFKIKYLDTAYFGGFCEPSKDLNKVTTMHANCCAGIEKKIHDLRLVLEDWKNFTALSTEEKRLRGTSSEPSPWRAPDKCKWW
ncbi:Nucleotide-diphospho-sugar transferase [Macleaya cordata]|uniref:Glycosyltransferase n=1 Tax=Macleaya cordata TaxID=56857 RepID=A0A200R494_MACCD|nr:Nucleotide-diphospho-sugar transferase [Macleaya cordata]